jgi:hypothetical protein
MIDRNIRFKLYKDRANYTPFHSILHVADVICFYYWLDSANIV